MYHQVTIAQTTGPLHQTVHDQRRKDLKGLCTYQQWAVPVTAVGMKVYQLFLLCTELLHLILLHLCICYQCACDK
ncbi:hypothetical protein AMELA_G00183900 [Ameiurus melas]|uniref:Uncharacterized protein n=1 Tax=Ameiurus melas TaxID=219545 RepID=A0A7J6ABB0_AMEME|nr:hypothetical protein AMELA_G00183900 [Ameiurus melas]